MIISDKNDLVMIWVPMEMQFRKYSIPCFHLIFLTSLTSKPPPSLIIMCSYYCQETMVLIALTSLLLIAHNLSSGNAALSIIKSSFKSFKMLANVTITVLHKNATCSAVDTQTLFCIYCEIFFKGLILSHYYDE